MAEPRAIVPDKGIRAGYNTSGSDIGANLVVTRVGSNPEDIDLPSAATDDVYGVTMEAIADTERGDVQVAGMAVCTAAAAITAGVEVMMDTAGKVLTATSGNKIVGVANTAASADGDLVEVELAGVGGPSVP